MENSTVKRERNEQCPKFGGLFSRILTDVLKSNAKTDKKLSLPLQVTTGEDVKSQNSNSTKQSSNVCTTGHLQKPVLYPEIYSKNSKILNDKSYKNSDKPNLNSRHHSDQSYKDPDKQSSSCRHFCDPHSSYKNPDKYNYTSKQCSDLHNCKSHKYLDKQGSNSRQYCDLHNGHSYKHPDKRNSTSRRYSDCHNSNSYKNLDKRTFNSRQYSDPGEKSYKNFDKFNSNCNQYSEFHDDDKESAFRLKNQSNKNQDNVRGKNLPCCNLSSEVDSQDEDPQNCIEFTEIKHQRTFSESTGSMKICVKNVSELVAVSNTSASLPSCTGFSNISDISRITNHNNAQILFSSEEENYIPPPVTSQSVNIPDSSSTSSEKNEMLSPQNDSTDVLPCPDGDESYFSMPDSEHLEAISNFILTTVEERSVSSSVADQVVRDLNILFKNHFEGNVIDVYGSYFSEVAITTSDINLVMIADISVRKSFMFEVYKILSSELEKYHVHPFDEGISAHKSKINFIHPDTGVNCQLAYLGKYKDNIFEMGKFLKRMCNIDVRVKTLIIATKIWAEHLTINEVEDGKLHPIGFALLVIHFLQHCENPILRIYCDDNEWENLSSNNSSVGELWLAFLKYFSVTFNWQQDVVTVTSKTSVSKKSKHWENYWIAIEDPFSFKNIAESVINSDTADCIKACFKSSYEYFSNPPDALPLSPISIEDQSSRGSSSSKFEFSFQRCIVEQSEIFCEICDEIDDVCDECKKKMYVQPMASVPKMTDSFLKKVKEVLLLVYGKYMLSDEEVNERKQFVKNLQYEVQKIYPDAQLNLFGSSTNGFGFKNSDLDICMTFKTEKVVKTAAVLKDLRYLLRKDKNFDHVIAIFNAQIPIIKFRHQPQKWRGDISLHNTLAVHNSQLLYSYSLIDERCKILGCALKLLAKKALIAEVTEKALSSYSYLNMVIHFLQQTDPPVLPVLQDNKFREDNYKLDDIVESCNVWFCRDISYIKKVFKAENDTPVEQLFLDLLDYYCSFNYNQLITIRQKEIQQMGEKQRSARLFNIQDPFIETKNLGCVVSATKAQETKNVFNRARQLFRTPIKELPTGVKDIEDYFFSTMSLTGRIHIEAHCDLCGKFGHEQKDCKQAYFHLQRNNFYVGRFQKQNTYASKSATYRRPLYRQPCRKQL